MAGEPDRTIMMPQVPKKGEKICFDSDPDRFTIFYRVAAVMWVSPPQNASPWAIVEISY